MDNKISTPLSFNGKLILDKSLFPTKEINGSELVLDKELLKNIVDKFEKATDKKGGTLVVSSGSCIADKSIRGKAYFKNGGYIDSCIFTDDNTLKELTFMNPTVKADKVVEKLLKFFDAFKLREEKVEKEIAPLKKEINKLAEKLNKSLREINYEVSNFAKEEKIDNFGNFYIDGTSNLPYNFKNFNTLDIKAMEKLQNECMK